MTLNFESIYDTNRNEILNSLKEVIEKKTQTIIPIQNKYLSFETSKYSSTKNNIWHVYLTLIISNEIQTIRIKKTSEYMFTYECLHCKSLNTCCSTQFLRKIRNCRSQCFQCNNIHLNSRKFPSKQKNDNVNKELTLLEKHMENLKEYENYPEIFKHSYQLSHLSNEDYDRIKPNIISLGNGKYTNIENYIFWSIYKVNNQMRFSSVFYDPNQNIIFKGFQPIMRCMNCTKTWRCKSLELFKNSYKILCNDCKLCNRTFKIRSMKNINNEIILYQSKLELKFINWCSSNKWIVRNGPNVNYSFFEKTKTYRVDFQIKNILIEIKDFHIWHKNQVDSGVWDAKVNAVNTYIKNNDLDSYFFITPNNWNQKTTELLQKLNKI
jgi:hypothetical protein